MNFPKLPPPHAAPSQIRGSRMIQPIGTRELQAIQGVERWEREMRRWLTEQMESATRNEQWERRHALKDCLDHLDWIPGNLEIRS